MGAPKPYVVGGKSFPVIGHATFVESLVYDTLSPPQDRPMVKGVIDITYGVKDGVTYDVIIQLEPITRDGKTFNCVMIMVDGKPVMVNADFFRISE